MTPYAIIQTLSAHNITLSLSNGGIDIENATELARMSVVSNRAAIINLLRIRDRGRADGRNLAGTCMTAAMARDFMDGCSVRYTGDELSAYKDGVTEGIMDGVPTLTLDEARETCESASSCERWKAAGNAAIKDGASEVQAVKSAAQVCRACNERETV
jgi:hypothetical protein